MDTCRICGYSFFSRFMCRNLLNSLACLFLFCCSFKAFSSTVSETLYINRSQLLSVDSTYLPYLAFNPTSAFESRNHIIKINANDTLILKVLNTDSLMHGFALKNYQGLNIQLNPGDTIIDTLVFEQKGIYIYYDDYLYPNNRYLGLAGMICVGNYYSSANFYWNIKEHSSLIIQDIISNQNVDWNTHDPEYYTINGKSFPLLNQDSLARITGNVGDTILIFISNTGQSIHSLHFHGYHSKIIFSSFEPKHTGRVKDTFPVYSMEGMILELIPDKPGEYPVHDHNLVAVTGNGMYPNGMLLTIKIEQ